MTSNTLYEWPLFPLKVLKTFSQTRRSSLDMSHNNPRVEELNGAKNGQNVDGQKNKKGCFEITSIEDHEDKEQHKDPIENKKTLYMVKQNSCQCGRWKCSDSKAPDSNINNYVEDNQAVEFIDKENGDKWLFCDPKPSEAKEKAKPVDPPNTVENQNISAQPKKEIGPIAGTRFIVRSIASSKEIETTSPLNGPAKEPVNNIPINNTTISPSTSFHSGTLNYILSSAESHNASAAETKAKTPLHDISRQSNLSKDVPDKPILTMNNVDDKIQEPSTPPSSVHITHLPNYKSVKNSLDLQKQHEIDYYRELESIVSKGPECCIDQQSRGFCCSKQLSTLAQATNQSVVPLYDTFNKSLDKISRVHAETLKSLTEQLKMLNDHIVELNHLIHDLKIENEGLKHERIHLQHCLAETRLSQHFTPEIIHSGNDESIYMLVEIVPGKKRLLNITQALTPAEMNHIKSLK